MRILFLAILCFCIFAISKGQPQSSSKSTKIDSLLNAYHTNGIFNGVALVSDEGEIILHKAYGLADREQGDSLSLNDRFYIGSLTKQFTAVLILLLQEDGLLNISDPISKYFPAFKSQAFKGISIHHLLTHTSGLDNYTAFPEFDAAAFYSESEMVKFIQRPLLFAPGKGWNYSNSGYYLLGKIAEKVGADSFGNLLSERIFNPLEMYHTAFDLDWLKADYAKGYWRTIEGMAPMPNYNLHSLLSSGGLYATALDLFIWHRALYDSKFLSDRSKEILFTPLLNDYACGFFVKKGIDELGNLYERHFHGGMIKGYHCFMLRRIPQNQFVILLDNHYNQEIQDIKNRIWSALVEEEIKIIKPKFSNLLFAAAANDSLINTIGKLISNPFKFDSLYKIEESDINTVGYRLMNAKRFEEAELLFELNIMLYPNAWNVYDSIGELYVQMEKFDIAKEMYRKSLELNPENRSAIENLENLSGK